MLDSTRRFKITRRHLLFLLPTLITAIAFIPYYILPVGTKLALFPIEQQPKGYFRTIGVISGYVLFPWNALCCVFSIKDSLSILGKKNKTFWITFIFIIAVVAASIFLSWVDTRENMFFYKTAIVIMTFLVIVLAVITASDPSFYIRIRMQTSVAKYTRSKLASLNVEALISHIDDLMDFEHLYRDSELSLSALSERLEISPHQLSEIINSHFGKNFNSYINDFRIEAAKKMLMTETGSSILSIGLACGFNSKSNFNYVFQKSVGMTPTAY